MNNDYHINYIEVKDLGILIREFKGVVTAERIIESWEEFKSKLADNNYKGVISDLSKSELKFGRLSLNIISDYYENNVDLFNSSMMAAVIDGPEVAVALNIEYNKNNVSNKFKAFSRRKAAMDWITRY